MEIIRVVSISGIGIVLIMIAVLMTQENMFLTKKMKKRYTDESIKVYCKKNCIGQIVFAVGLSLEGIFSSGIFFYLGIGCLFVGVVLMIMALKKLVKKYNM